MGKFSTIKINVPDLNKTYVTSKINYSNEATKKANIDLLKRIKTSYGIYINKWAKLFELDAGIIIGFIATESAGVMRKPNAYDATGLMQVTPNALAEAVSKWDRYVNTPLPAEAQQILKEKTPFLVALKPDQTLTDTQKQSILNALATDANYNIVSGVILLRWLLQIFKSTGYGQLNKAMVAYNAGLYREPLRVKGNFVTAPIDSLSLSKDTRVPAESRAYIVKMLGVDGFLDLIFRQKVA